MDDNEYAEAMARVRKAALEEVWKLCSIYESNAQMSALVERFGAGRSNDFWMGSYQTAHEIAVNIRALIDKEGGDGN